MFNACIFHSRESVNYMWLPKERNHFINPDSFFAHSKNLVSSNLVVFIVVASKDQTTSEKTYFFKFKLMRIPNPVAQLNMNIDFE